MKDISATIIAKSDQLNADDLIGLEREILITEVQLSGFADQPLHIHYEGDNGKPWKPCKAMRRVLLAIWGADGDSFVGRRLVLFRDPDVTWAGQAVGGIRIKAMEGLQRPYSIALTVARGKKALVEIQPLVAPLDRLKALISKLNTNVDALCSHFEVETIGDLNPEQLSKAIAALEKKGAKQ